MLATKDSRTAVAAVHRLLAGLNRAEAIGSLGVPQWRLLELASLGLRLHVMICRYSGCHWLALSAESLRLDHVLLFVQERAIGGVLAAQNLSGQRAVLERARPVEVFVIEPITGQGRWMMDPLILRRLQHAGAQIVHAGVVGPKEGLVAGKL